LRLSHSVKHSNVTTRANVLFTICSAGKRTRDFRRVEWPSGSTFGQIQTRVGCLVYFTPPKIGLFSSPSNDFGVSFQVRIMTFHRYVLLGLSRAFHLNTLCAGRETQTDSCLIVDFSNAALSCKLIKF